MGQHVARVARDVERDVADEPDPTLVGIPLEREPLSLEARLRASLVVTGALHPLLEPRSLRRPLVSLAVVVVLRAGPGQQALVARECRLRGVRRAVLVRDVERQQLPPGLPRLDEPVHETVGLFVEPPGWQRGDVQQHAAHARTPEHGGHRPSACAIAATCSGLDPQQPPTTRAPCST